MPFRAEELRRSDSPHSIEKERPRPFLPAHGRPLGSVGKSRTLGLAGQVLDASPQEHPDFHTSGPQSKSRQITVEQMRELRARNFTLRPFVAPLKVAVIFDAERMCLGSARRRPMRSSRRPEEPPAHTLILLTSGRPAMLLPPPSSSRCLRLDLGFEDIDSALVTRRPRVDTSAGKRAAPERRAARPRPRAGPLYDHWTGIARDRPSSHIEKTAPRRTRTSPPG